jgi:alkylation response protein AidB-like acyl-CoA dehydrogenase
MLEHANPGDPRLASREQPISEGAAILEAAATLRPVIRGYQEEIERERRIPKALVRELRDAGLYRLVRPNALGGAEVDQLTLLHAIELVSEGDGSVGWNVATNAQTTLAALALPDEGVHEVFGGGDVILAGTIGTGGGKGVPVEGGYVVSGRWTFGSGCQESDWMIGGFEVADGEAPGPSAEGTRSLWRGLFRSSECTVIETWDTTGLRGTGSHDWAVTDVFVPTHRTVAYPGQPTRNNWNRWPGPFYALPGPAFNGPHMAAVATGIARAAIDALTELAGSKVPRHQPGLLRKQAQVQEWVGRAEALLGSAQAYRDAVTREIWDTVTAGRPVSTEQLARCRLAACTAADNAMQATDLMFRAGGTTSIASSHRIARCWRDVHVVGQNLALLPEYYLLGGRYFLGLDPGEKLS